MICRIAIASLLCLVSLRADSVLEGHVTLPKPRTPTVVNQRYEVVVKGGVVSTEPPLAIVYLEGRFPKPAELPVRRIVQKDLAFAPSVLPVQAGTRVEFPNEDSTYHNIFSYSRPKRFDLGRYRSDERPIPSEVFDTPGLVTLRCDIHEHMRAIILVLDTPHFVLTDPSGDFRLTGVPPGKYLLKAWLNSQTTRELPVEIPDGATVRADFP
ncbi:hypothetical protein DB347_22445 [Opitutaceae bacterium EW11]|nr:hypothetical protein DB347_22445 [Opitutaceae bacterium EW11]